MTIIKYNRKLNRMRGYDYSTRGAYFVTICVHGRQNLFGEIINGNMILNDAGNMIKTVWYEIPCYYHGTGIDEFVVMPDHIHGIIIVDKTSIHHAAVRTTPRGCPTSTGHPVITTPRGCPASTGQPVMTTPCGCHETNIGQARGLVATGSSPAGAIILSLPDIMQRYKTMTTKRYTDGVKQNGWPGFFGKLWQRSYHDRIIRDEDELNRIRKYIINNPSKWQTRKYHKQDDGYSSDIIENENPVRTTPRGCPDNINTSKITDTTEND